MTLTNYPMEFLCKKVELTMHLYKTLILLKTIIKLNKEMKNFMKFFLNFESQLCANVMRLFFYKEN
ncbi:hypothetical protein BpHYR1_052421 [Brachionus plicatilis]|uniref:Uncharacterized protein n=1 Tax=Brachionus plicatilis TaxID=10195 RepID=A0A3M7QNN9_BRAPC|nr:hypothetical protein BpHYR1_052421 [Brachionus plicatilis]